MALVLEARRDDLATARVIPVEPSTLQDGQTRFAVERFGLTANNITYGLLGDQLGYWSFFPSTAEGWGRVPAWGFATAVETRCRELTVGTRIFGFVPMGVELVLTPREVRERGLHDGSAHRAELPTAYQSYRFAEPSHRDDATMVLRPLFVTAVLLARSLEGEERVVFSSASSKTALGAAHLLARRGVEVAGITASYDLVAGLGVYDEVVGYDAIGELERRPATFVDVAGDARIRAAVHRHLGDELRASVLVGATHLGATPPTAETLPGPEPRFFFAPDHLGGGVDTRDLAELMEWSARWLEIDRRDGPDAVLATWGQGVRGDLPPTRGLSLSLASNG